MERIPMERSLATPADAEIILKLYDLRRETLMREARAWITGEFWPSTAEEYFVVASNPADPHNAFVRMVIGYWEMAAALVLHGAVSPELFVDCNNEGFFLLGKFAPFLDEIRQRNPMFLQKTTEMIKRFTSAASKYEAVQKTVDAMRSGRQQRSAPVEYAFPHKS
jgi:hypothetical protein